jgi:hypothetical protein
MNRITSLAVAMALGFGLLSAACSSGPETTKEPQAEALPTPVLPPSLAELTEGEGGEGAVAKSKFVSPIRGRADIGHLPVQTKVVGNEVVTTIRIKNMSPGPIAGMKVEEFWWDKNQSPVPGGGTFRHTKLLMPAEDLTVTFKSPKDARMFTNNYKFSHANGDISAKQLKRLDEDPEDTKK